MTTRRARTHLAAQLPQDSLGLVNVHIEIVGAAEILIAVGNAETLVCEGR